MNIWQRIKKLFRKEEPEEVEDDLILDCPPDLSLLDVLDAEVTLLATLNELEGSGLYDTQEEDKIKCMVDAYKVIAATQRALLKEIKELSK